MAFNGDSRRGLLDASGVLSILGGLLELIAGGIVLSIARNIMLGGPLRPIPHIPWMPGLEIQLVFFPTRVIIVGILILVLGAIGVAGGISALRRKSFGLSLAGAICIIPTILFGILAVIFVVVSKREFGAEAKENGITSRSRLLTAGGILSIIGGGVEVIGAVSLRAFVYYPVWLPVVPVLLCFGFLAIIGGTLAVGRKGYSASLTGAACAVPSGIFGILSVIFVAMRKSEFEVADEVLW